MSDQLSRHRDEFFREIREILDKVRDDLLEEGARGRAPRIDSLYRGIHTICGTCRIYRLPELERAGLGLEAAVIAIRDGNIPVGAELIAQLVEATDRFADLLDCFEGEKG